MILRDHKKLQRLLVIQEVTHRELAAAAGYRAHSYVSRLARGEVHTVGVDAARRIAQRLKVGVDDLFLPDEASNSGRTDQNARRVS